MVTVKLKTGAKGEDIKAPAQVRGPTARPVRTSLERLKRQGPSSLVAQLGRTDWPDSILGAFRELSLVTNATLVDPSGFSLGHYRFHPEPGPKVLFLVMSFKAWHNALSSHRPRLSDPCTIHLLWFIS